MSTASLNIARQRIVDLLDDNSFVEIGAGVCARATDFNLNQVETPSDGVVTGYGILGGKLVYVYSQDTEVLGGSMGEMHSKKIINLYTLAMKMGAPMIALLDSSGLRLQEGTDALYAFGQIYLQETMASGVIPQITGIFGSCGGGIGVIPSLADFTFMEKNARLYINAPNALVGNHLAKCDTATADFQGKECGTVDVVAPQDELLMKIRTLVSMLPSNCEDTIISECTTDSLNRLCTELENYEGNAVEMIKVLADGHSFFECKEMYAPEMVTGFIPLNGTTVGVVANSSMKRNDETGEIALYSDLLTVKGCEKATEFIQFCDSFSIPVVSLTNTSGFEASIEAETGIAKKVAKLTYAFSNATVPKVNLIVGKSFGSAGIAMNSKAIGADLTMAWPDAKMGMMEGRLAAKIIASGSDKTELDEIESKYNELQSSIESAVRRGYVDQIVEKQDTRKYLIGAFEMLFTKKEDRPVKKHGTV